MTRHGHDDKAGIRNLIRLNDPMVADLAVDQVDVTAFIGNKAEI